MQHLEITIEELLGDVGPPIVGVDAKVEAAIGAMKEIGFGCVLVVEDGQLAGILTRRDVLSRIAAAGLTSSGVTIGEVMRPQLDALMPTDGLSYAINRMAIGWLRHVPIVDIAGAPVGVLTVADVLSHLSEVIQDLEEIEKFERGEATHEWVDIGGG